MRNDLAIFIHQLQLSTGADNGSLSIHQFDQGLRIVLLKQILTGINHRNIINHHRHGDLNCALTAKIQCTCGRGFNTVAGNNISRADRTKIQCSATESKTANPLNTGANRCDISGFRHQHGMGQPLRIQTFQRKTAGAQFQGAGKLIPDVMAEFKSRGVGIKLSGQRAFAR